VNNLVLVKTCKPGSNSKANPEELFVEKKSDSHELDRLSPNYWLQRIISTDG
jgi:hypothetical protein